MNEGRNEGRRFDFCGPHVSAERGRLHRCIPRSLILRRTTFRHPGLRSARPLDTQSPLD